MHRVSSLPTQVYLDVFHAANTEVENGSTRNNLSREELTAYRNKLRAEGNRGELLKAAETMLDNFGTLAFETRVTFEARPGGDDTISIAEIQAVAAADGNANEMSAEDLRLGKIEPYWDTRAGSPNMDSIRRAQGTTPERRVTGSNMNQLFLQLATIMLGFLFPRS